jgi:hypothetical protein
MGWPERMITTAVTWAYHRWNEARAKLTESLPRSEEGAVVPLLYGRVRVDKPIVAWVGGDTVTPRAGHDDGSFIYGFTVVFVLGTPFRNGTIKLRRILAGDRNLVGLQIPPPLSGSSPALGGALKDAETDGIDQEDPKFMQVRYEFAGGTSSQDMIDVSANTSGLMILGGVDEDLIPSFREYATVAIDVTTMFEPNPPPFAFEISTYPAGSSSTNVIGDEANPVAVIEDILIGVFGKLGLPAAIIDPVSFNAAAATLKSEEHGYSRCIDAPRDAGDIINEILTQIDGVLYEDMRYGTIGIKLIRADYEVADLRHITPDNCDEVQDFTAGGWTDIANKIRVVFPDRDLNYEDRSATAQNQANAVGQSGRISEVVLRFPGVCTSDLADAIAARELAARSRPIARCRVVVNREFLRTNVGDAVRVTWPEYHLAELVFRVAQVDRGTLADGKIALDLIQDFNYVYRRKIASAGSGDIAPFPSGGLLIE